MNLSRLNFDKNKAEISLNSFESQLRITSGEKEAARH